MPRSRPAYSSSSSPLSRSNNRTSAGTTPMTALAAGGSRHTSSPLIRTWPRSGRSSPVIIDRDVVFPAPFGPTSPAREPAAISRLIPATASLAPKLLCSPRTTIAGSPMLASSATMPRARHLIVPGRRRRVTHAGGSLPILISLLGRVKRRTGRNGSPGRELPGQRTHPVAQFVRLLDDERKSEAGKDRRDPVEALGTPPSPYPPGPPL